MKNTFTRSAKILSIAASTLLLAPACTKDLNRTPTYDLTADKVYKDAAGYKTQLAKLYGGFALTGSQGPAGTPDIKGIDEGTSDYIRQLWSAQELTTDEAVIQWGDPGIQDWHNLNWTSNGVLIRGLYSRLMYEVTICNSYLQQAADAQLTSRGITSTDAGSIATFRAEARFLRALAYYHALDLYGNTAFATEKDIIGGTVLPPRTTRADLFTYIETELKAIDTSLLAPRANEYGRADQAAAWALLAKLYLNAQVYTGTPRYADAATYAKKVIDAGYKLLPKYGNLFLADNDKNNTEIIFPIVFDGKFTQSYGGTTFLTHVAVPSTAVATWNPAFYGIGGGWGGARTTANLFQQFPDTASDSRGRFHTGSQSLAIVSLTDFQYGYVPIKFRNVTSAGVAGSDNTFVDADYPMFRLGDMYLTYAEAAVRGGGDMGLALTYVNTVRSRAYNNTTNGNITASNLTLDFLLAERSRELFWEATRRTDLIRFGRFTSASYLWPWKGGVMAGQGVADTYNLLPIPSSELSINPNLQQNPGY
ncbi:RagB/SusD family nutrient uptake outer membrane protein [Hymenobacter psoromatis]|uniref:RagB/SusD family nutrient uptake outer membrane protein n=1 Tax=Hymenobacter psoromatis TaxID=1484116 RepID=UPI001CBC9DE6|nr:RagB/SusD family nutrient uptake outer membrane protein [Hymenobacter psoromatis]